jgi:hypothetical protein
MLANTVRVSTFRGQTVVLSKHPPKHLGAKRLVMKDYTTDLGDPPANVDYLSGMPDALSVMLNDSLGDCTCAGLGHAIQVFTANNGNMITVPDAAVLKAYKDFCGYNGTPSTDNGGVETDVLKGACSEGIGGYKFDAFVSLQPENDNHIKWGVDLCGVVYIGLNLPLSAQGQSVWEVDLSQGAASRPGSWGGHCVIVASFDADGITCITWGIKVKMTWRFWFTYCDESYAILAQSLWAPKGTTPGKFPYAQVVADAQALAAA